MADQSYEEDSDHKISYEVLSSNNQTIKKEHEKHLETNVLDGDECEFDSINENSLELDGIKPVQPFKRSRFAECFCDFSLVSDEDGKNSNIQLAHCFPKEGLNKLNVDKGSLRTLCFPSGLIVVDKNSNPIPNIHIFNVTLQDYTQYTGVALTFFENLPSELVTAILNKFIGFQSHNSSLQNEKLNIFELDTMLSNFITSNPLIDENDIDRVKSDNLIQNLLVSRVICFISKNTNVNMLIEGLKIIFGSIKQNLDPTSFIKSYICEVFMPPIGLSTVYSFGSNLMPQIFQYSPRLENIPNPDYKLIYLFNYFSLESLITLFACVLLESQIILLSESTYKLSLVSNSLRHMIFPFYWDHIFVSLLPLSLIHSLEAPCPYIMGVQSTSSINLGINTSKSNMRCIVDIDCGRVMCNEDIPAIPHCDELINKLKMILDVYRPNGGLYESIKSHSNKYKSPDNRMDNNMIHHHNHDSFNIWNDGGSDYQLTKTDIMFNNEVLCAFLDLFTTIFETYNRYIIWPSVSKTEFEHSSLTKQALFGQTAFLCGQNFENLPFLSQFIESQLFVSFVYNKIKHIFGKTTKSNFIFDSILANSFDVKLKKNDLIACKTKKIDLPKGFDEKLYNSIGTQNYDFSLMKYDWYKIFESMLSHEDTLDIQNDTESFDSFDVNVDAITEFGQKRTQESKNLNIIKGLLIDIKVRINQILVFKLDYTNFSNYVEDRNINSETQLCSSLLSILRKIFSHGLMDSVTYRNIFEKFSDRNPLDSPFWFFISNYYRVLHEQSKHLIQEDDFKLRNTSFDESGNILCIPDVKRDLMSIFKFVVDLNLETPEQNEEAFFFLLLERNLLADILCQIIENASSLSVFYRWAFLRRNNFSMSLIHHLKNLDQITFDCFTKTYGSKKIYYRILSNFEEYPPANLPCIIEFICQNGSKVKYVMKKILPEIILKLSELNDVILMRISFDSDYAEKYTFRLLYILFRNEISAKTQLFCFNNIYSNNVDGFKSSISCSKLLPANIANENLMRTIENVFKDHLHNSICISRPSSNMTFFNLRRILPFALNTQSQENSNRIISQKDAQNLVNKLVEILSVVDSKSSKSELINIVFYQHGILDILSFIFKYNYGQFQIVEFFNGMTHPFYMFLYLRSMFHRKTIENPALLEYKKSGQIIFNLVHQVSKIGENYSIDEKLSILLWILCNKKYLYDFFEIIMNSNYQAQFYGKISFTRNIHLLGSAKKLIIQLHNHDLIKSRYFKTDFPYSKFIQ